LVVLGENVDVDLVANRWLARSRWVATVVGSLGFASSGTGENTLREGWVVNQAEELVAHISVGLGLGVKRSVNGATKGSWALETILSCWGSDLVVSVGSSNDNREFP
jgi:hypothetical protein